MLAASAPPARTTRRGSGCRGRLLPPNRNPSPAWRPLRRVEVAAQGRAYRRAYHWPEGRRRQAGQQSSAARRPVFRQWPAGGHRRHTVAESMISFAQVSSTDSSDFDNDSTMVGGPLVAQVSTRQSKQARLEQTRGPGAPRTFELALPETIVGRSTSAHICIDS